MDLKRRVKQGSWNQEVNDFWWKGMKSKRKAIAVNLEAGRSIEEKAIELMVEYFEGITEDGKSTLKVIDYENDAVIQSLKTDFVAGHGIYNVSKRCYMHSKKYMVSVKTLAIKPNGYVWKGNDAIYISKGIWEDLNDLSTHMIVGNDNEYYLIDTDRFKRFPELLSPSTRPNYVKIKLNRHLEDGDVIDLINDKYIK